MDHPEHDKPSAATRRVETTDFRDDVAVAELRPAAEAKPEPSRQPPSRRRDRPAA